MLPHQRDRIETFLNPDREPKGKGYNVIQSKLAVGSGGFTGKEVRMDDLAKATQAYNANRDKVRTLYEFRKKIHPSSLGRN
jgi:benzoyl-CoA reductase/2-hydroxyglutaryl-CoA dehydratase subunit BcrC/BadD/HgdB